MLPTVKVMDTISRQASMLHSTAKLETNELQQTLCVFECMPVCVYKYWWKEEEVEAAEPKFKT